MLSFAAQASGHLPPITLPPSYFGSFEQCRAHLQQVHEDDMNGTQDGDVALDNGGTRRKTVETKGVVMMGETTARYEATVGWATRTAPDETRGYVETNFSYDHTVLECVGAKLSEVRDSGYYLPGYEPIPGWVAK
ncbi:hypothetical protein PQR78_02955 [Paraburkholderia agricolaris]